MNLDNSLDLAIPDEVFFGIWLNSWRTKAISARDCSYAAEELFATQVIQVDRESLPWYSWIEQLSNSPAPYLVGWPVPGDNAGLPKEVTHPAIALDANRLLFKANLNSFAAHRLINEPLKFAVARQSQKMKAVLQQAGSLLTSGDRELVELTLNSRKSLRLPNQVSPNITHALDQAANIRAISVLALTHVEAPTSRSGTLQLHQQLTDLRRSSELVMCAAASSAI